MTHRADVVTAFRRDGSRASRVGHYHYSWGGWSVEQPEGEESYHDVYRSSGDLSLWHRLPDAPWHGRHVFGCVVKNNETYVIGGDNIHSVFDVWKTSNGTDWKYLSTVDWTAYYGCCLNEADGYIYVVGGAATTGAMRSLDGVTWESRADVNRSFLNDENFANSLAYLDGYLYMICGGGTGGGTGTARNTVWRSNDGAQTWVQRPDFPGIAVYYTDVLKWDNRIWLVNGYSEVSSNIEQIWYMDANEVWTQLGSLPGTFYPSHATGIGIYQDQLVITCGNFENKCHVISKT